MTLSPPTCPHTSLNDGLDVSAATERLFLDIARSSGNPAFSQSMAILNQHLQLIRPYEDGLIPDRAAELQALSDCWAQRDMDRLQGLLAAYFQRRQALAPQLARLINHSN